MDKQELNEIGRQPLSAGSPCGEDISMSEDFIAIRDEIAKLSRPVPVAGDEVELAEGQPRFQYQTVDWHWIIERSGSLLKTESRDIWLVAWLGNALVRTRGAAGLASCLQLTADLLENFWEHVHPARHMGRSNALMKLRDSCLESLQGAPGVEPLPLGEHDREQLKLSREAIERINTAIDSHTDGNPGPYNRASMNRLERLLDDKVRQLKPKNALKKAFDGLTGKQESPEPSRQQQPEANHTTQPANNSAPTSLTSSTQEKQYDFSDQQQVRKYLTDLKKPAIELHQAALQKGILDPLPYRWIRIVFWSPLNFSPGHKVVPFHPPNSQLQERLHKLWQNRDWQTLFTEAEKNFRIYAVWLDLQRYVCDAAEGLGSKHAAIAEAVRLETTFLLRRLPHLVNMQYRDGVPLVGPETQDWASETSAMGTEDTSGASGDAQELPGNEEDRSTAGKVAFSSESPVSEILEKARGYLRASRSGREAFEIELALAMVLLKRKEIQLAYHYLDNIAQMIDTCNLEVWEPELAIGALCRLHNGCTEMMKIKKDERAVFAQRALSIVSRVARLDPVIAAKLAK
jgi:type VI secretion system protein VasJ